MGMPVTVKTQVAIPKPIRDHLCLRPGDRVEFELGSDGTVSIHKSGPSNEASGNRFAYLMGCATAGLTTDEIMALTRGEE